jgi:hypothetical protein
LEIFILRAPESRMVKRELNVFGDSSESESESGVASRTFKEKKRLKFIPPPLGEDNFSQGKAASKDVSRPEATRNTSHPEAPSKHISPSIDDSRDYMDFHLQDDVTSRHPKVQLGLNYDDLQRVNRETALNTSLFSRPNMSIGLSMMEKMGFKVGDVLGKKLDLEQIEKNQNLEMEKNQNLEMEKNQNLEMEKNQNLKHMYKPGVRTTIGMEPIDVKGIFKNDISENSKQQSSIIFNKPAILTKLEPINIIVKPDRGGIGATTDLTTDLLVLTLEFRNRVGDAKRDDKLTKNLTRIQKLCFEMSGEANRYYDGMSIENIDPLWRSYVREYEDKTSKLKNARKRIRVDETVSSEDISTSMEGDNEPSDITRCDGNETYDMTKIHDNESSDMTSRNIHTSDIYIDLDQQENLLLLLQYLRLVHNFCWFCGERFEDEEDLNANCPGITEELHNL